jgi:hypothetical protein
MRRDLVEAVLDAASFALFEDVLYTHAPAGPALVKKAISGVEIISERFEMLGRDMRGATHTTRVLLSKLPTISIGDGLDDGAQYRVLDLQPVGDGRFEVEASLLKL